LLPYIAVAIPLMWYNYARFGDVLEFGLSYQLTNPKMTSVFLANPMGTLYKFIKGVWVQVFAVPAYKIGYPFVYNFIYPLHAGAESPTFWGNSGVSFLGLPVFWPLFAIPLIRRDLKSSSPLFRGSVIAAPLLCVIYAGILAAGVSLIARYECDVIYFAAFAALVCWYFLLKRAGFRPLFVKAAATLLFLSAVIPLMYGSESLYTVSLKPYASAFLKDLFLPLG